MLKDMLEFSARVLDTATDWAETREATLTEELDAHLRAHRPRAGRIEEVRARDRERGRGLPEGGLGHRGPFGGRAMRCALQTTTIDLQGSNDSRN